MRKLHTFDNYCVVHEKFMWDAHMEPGVVNAFSKVWNTNELLVSFDSLNITPPGCKDKLPWAPWPQVVQSPFQRGLHCIQGIIDLIMWDSQTVHWGDEPTANSKTIQTIIYASYSSAKLATKEVLEEKARVFNVYGATTRWAHDNIWPRPQLVHLPDGTVDPRNRGEPLEKPGVNDMTSK